MKLLSQIAGILTLIVYVPLTVGILRNTIQQSFMAFLLWAMLDSIAAITIILQGGNYWLPLGNAIGTIAVTVALAIKKQISWSWVEMLTAIMVVICLLIWYSIGPAAGTISSSIALLLASIPQMVSTWQKPWTTPKWIYATFLLANILSLLAGKSWAIEERLYASCSLLLCAMILAFSFRQTATSNSSMK